VLEHCESTRRAACNATSALYSALALPNRHL
jgi:hypothetical protein